MDQLVQAVLSYGLILWHLLDRGVAWLGLLHKQVRGALNEVHVPAALDNGIIGLFWLALLVVVFRALPVWGRFVLVFCVSVLVAKLFGAVPTR